MLPTTEGKGLALRRARQFLLEYGQCPDKLLNPRLAQSWQRSLAAGLTPIGSTADAGILSGSDLRLALLKNHELLEHSQPVMEFLFGQVQQSDSMLVLTDRHGVVMHTLGTPAFLGKAERVALAVGSSWHEDWRGTNAVGTALVEERSVEINGSEHFLEQNGFLTCAAAPIVDATGKLLGILDITGDHRSRHPHTLGLASTAARMIENRLLETHCRHNIRLHFHERGEGVGTVAEGIIVLSDDGWLVGANRAGLTGLSLTKGDIGTVSLGNILAMRLDDILSFSRRHPEELLRLPLFDGRVLFARVHNHPEKFVVPATTVKPALKLAPPPADALSRFDTGDARWHGATEKARRVLDKPVPLLLLGESGVGKEIFARACHESGARRQGLFIAINCAALPENLIESELFGYLPGAFTGARKEGYVGRIREAHGGTLFLDEIGDMPVALQTRLLRVLQERQVTQLGGGKTVDVDFALICATHHDLRQTVKTGAFRSDLYYRINGLTLNLPPLRERSDFVPLTQGLLEKFAPNRKVTVADQVFAQLKRYSWPGNLRQYASLLQTAIAMLDPWETEIGWQHLPDDITEDLLETTATGEVPQIRPEHGLLGSLAEISLMSIQQTLEVCGGNLTETARRLGVSRQTLYRKLAKQGHGPQVLRTARRSCK